MTDPAKLRHVLVIPAMSQICPSTLVGTMSTTFVVYLPFGEELIGSILTRC